MKKKTITSIAILILLAGTVAGHTAHNTTHEDSEMQPESQDYSVQDITDFGDNQNLALLVGLISLALLATLAYLYPDKLSRE